MMVGTSGGSKKWSEVRFALRVELPCFTEELMKKTERSIMGNSKQSKAWSAQLDL
jgi:hypothetical protein